LHLARDAPWFIMRLAGQAQYRRSRLTSNVRRHMKHLRLGLFTFKNDDVLLLAGDRPALLDLAKALETARKHQAVAAVHEIAEVSQKYPAKLYAARKPDAPLTGNEFYWPVDNDALDKVRLLADSGSERYFELSNSMLLLVSAIQTYNTAWWETYA
jgi:hypothetical protein